MDAVDFEKGCYLGQETVARIHYRGQVNRLLAIVGSKESLPAGAELRQGDEVVGQVSSVAPVGDEWIGLVLLPRAAAEPGTMLAGPGGALVQVDNNVETHPNATTAAPAS